MDKANYQLFVNMVMLTLHTVVNVLVKIYLVNGVVILLALYCYCFVRVGG